MICLSWLAPALAQDVTCRKGEETRRLGVVPDRAGVELPCEVVMWSAPGEPRRLWRAEYQRGFCADKLRSLIDKLTDDQWRCTPSRSPLAPAPSPPVKAWPAGRPPVM